MNNINYIAVVIVLVVGAVIGWLVKPNDKVTTYEKELHEERIERAKERDSLNDIIDGTLHLRSLDSILIHDLRQAILKQDGVRVEMRKKLENMSEDEKLDWLFNRYNYKPE